MPPWSTIDDAALRSTYASGGIAEACAALPSRSRNAIFLRANRIGIRSPRYWTEDDDKRLVYLWGECKLGRLAVKLNRSAWACYERAGVLGLRRGCPRGKETVNRAAERAGFSRVQFKKLLDRYGVPISLAMSKPYSRKASGHRARWKHHVVDPHDVDEAVAAWVRE